MASVDYMDADVAYLLGMLVARGEMIASENTYRIIIHFPKGALLAEGITLSFNTNREILLGIERVRERLIELLGADCRTVDAGESWDLVVRSTRRTMAWRNISMLLDNQTSFPYFSIPAILLEEATPLEYKREFVRGYADVAGNIRPSNRDQTGTHRVRLDTLNYSTNWTVPVQLCLLLQNHLEVGVPHIAWGHPNLGRHWREHQLNIYAHEFLRVGFGFEYKQRALVELAEINTGQGRYGTSACPGQRRPGPRKPTNPEEDNVERLSAELRGQHYDAYWQICSALGCRRRPSPSTQLELVLEEPSELP